MKWARNEEIESEILASLHEDMRDETRTQLSVTSLIYCLTKTFYNREMGLGANIAPSREQTLLFSTGLGLEDVLLKDRKFTVKGVHEGIAYHVDSIGKDYDQLTEFKSTRLSSKKTPDDFSNSWLRQYKSYLKAEGKTGGHYIVIHLMGNYAPPFPDLRAYEIEFTQEEIDENWNWIKGRQATYLDHVERKAVPEPFKFNEDWECTNCEFLGLCKVRTNK